MRHDPFEQYEVLIPPIAIHEGSDGTFEATCDAYPEIMGIGNCEEEALDDFLYLLPASLFSNTIH